MTYKELDAHLLRLANRFRSLRAHAGHRQASFKDVSASSINKIEHGYGGNVATIIRYADELGYELTLVPKPAERERILNQIESTF